MGAQDGFFSRNSAVIAETIKKGMNTGGVYIDDGTYMVEVLKTKMISTEAGMAFIAELRILESSNPKHPIGQSVSWYCGFNKFAASAHRDVMLFYAAMAGHEKSVPWIEQYLTPQILDLLAGPQSPVDQWAVHMPLVVRKRDNKTNDGQFSVHYWGNAKNVPEMLAT